MSNITNIEEVDLSVAWPDLMNFLKANVGKKPSDLKGVLFLIGLQELGKGNQHFSKEEKQDIIHIAVCKVLSYAGFYELDGYDAEGWPHWKSAKPLPFVDMFAQEVLLKHYVIHFFRNEIGVHI